MRRDIERLLADASIVRHRGKIEATIANARATVALRETEPLPELFWASAPERHDVPGSTADWHASTPESAALSKRLKRVGFRFVGPTTVYAAMQACGVVNDHLAGCWVREAVEARAPTSVLTGPVDFRSTAERRWSGVGDFKYGQWRYQLVEVCPRDLTGNRLASVGDSR